MVGWENWFFFVRVCANPSCKYEKCSPEITSPGEVATGSNSCLVPPAAVRHGHDGHVRLRAGHHLGQGVVQLLLRKDGISQEKKKNLSISSESQAGMSFGPFLRPIFCIWYFCSLASFGTLPGHIFESFADLATLVSRTYVQSPVLVGQPDQVVAVAVAVAVAAFPAPPVQVEPGRLPDGHPVVEEGAPDQPAEPARPPVLLHRFHLHLAGPAHRPQPGAPQGGEPGPERLLPGSDQVPGGHLLQQGVLRAEVSSGGAAPGGADPQGLVPGAEEGLPPPPGHGDSSACHGSPPPAADEDDHQRKEEPLGFHVGGGVKMSGPGLVGADCFELREEEGCLLGLK